MKLTLKEKELIANFLNAAHVSAVGTQAKIENQQIECTIASEHSKDAVDAGFTVDFMDRLSAKSQIIITRRYLTESEKIARAEKEYRIESDEVISELLLMAKNFHKSCKVAFLMGLHHSGGKGSTLEGLGKNSIFDRNLLKGIFQHSDAPSARDESKEEMSDALLCFKYSINAGIEYVRDCKDEFNAAVAGQSNYDQFGRMTLAVKLINGRCLQQESFTHDKHGEVIQRTIEDYSYPEQKPTYCGFKPGFLMVKR